MPRLVQIGNSMGVRIPKNLIKQTKLAGCELEFQVTDDGLLLRAARRPRQDWEQAFVGMHAEGEDELVLSDTPNEFDKDEWEW